MEKKLYIFVHSYDEGFDGPDFLYYAYSKLEVAERILSDMRDKTKQGEGLRRIFTSMRIDNEIWKYNHELSHERNESSRILFIMTRTPEELLKIIEQSYVDGDSSSRITISESKISDIIDLTSGKDDVTGGTPLETQKDFIEIYSKEQVMSIVDCAFHKYQVSHLIWNEKSWYSHSVTSWRDERWVPSGKVGDHDVDHPCYGYWCHCFDRNASDKEGDPEESVDLPYVPLRVKKLEDVKHVFVPIDRSYPEFKLDDKIRLPCDWNVCNDMGFNSDHRGSNHLGIDIDGLFDGSVDIKAGDYTFADLADLIWRAKANKFDNQYELVCNTEAEKIVYENNTWYVGLTVDHGS